MTKYAYRFLLVWILTIFFNIDANATVEWEFKKPIVINKAIRDMAVSSSGKWVFVLTGDGKLAIYQKDGQLKDKFTVGRHFDRIQVGDKEEQLFLTDSLKGSIQEISLTFIHDFNLTDAPFLGLKEAPISIVAFMDYQ